MNKQWRLKKRPEAAPSEDCFELVEAAIPELEPGKALITHCYSQKASLPINCIG